MPSASWLNALIVLSTLALPVTHTAEPQNIDQTLQPYLKEFGLPALAAAVFKGDTILAAGAVGTRRVNTQNPVKLDDAFHIGSDSKAFTALLIGQLVEAGKLKWSSTMAEVFPELKSKMNGDFAKVTIEQLLSHTSGLSDKPHINDLLARSYLQEGNMDEVRYWMLEQLAPKALTHKPGEQFDYCNLGYVIAGVITERESKKTWEELVEEKIFKPLNLKSAGFGPQARIGLVDAPLGHALINGKPFALLAGPNGDNPIILGPAGTIHMSVLDFAKWTSWQASEGKQAPHLVSGATLKKMHTPVVSTGSRDSAAAGTPKTGGYGLGWGQVTVPWVSSPAVMHTGSNTINLATIMFWPDTDRGLVMMTNVGGETADNAFKKLAPVLYKLIEH
jgi:CubicO group peptidase (beta-lactamase class C family)